MKTNLKAMSVDELKSESKKTLKNKKILRKACNAIAILSIAGIFTAIPVAFSMRDTQQEIEARQEFSYTEYCDNVVTEQKENLRNQVKNGEISFDEYDEKITDIKQPSKDDYFATWSESDRIEHEEADSTAIRSSMGILFGSGLMAAASLSTKACLEDKLLQKARNLDELAFQKSYNKRGLENEKEN